MPDPAAEGQPEEWLPLGVWALIQHEQGDATMFVQLSIDKDGLVAGAYKNIMTGDELPIIGHLDRKTQRVAWHFGEATQTVYETGLSSLQMTSPASSSTSVKTRRRPGCSSDCPRRKFRPAP